MIVKMYQSAALKEAIDDLEWPGSSVQISLQKSPPCVTFRGEGHGDLQVLFCFSLVSFLNMYRENHVGCTLLFQIDFMYYANTDLLLTFHCDTEVSYR